MQKCKIFEAKNEKELEEKYADWAKDMNALVEVTHMNTFMKGDWYKMVILYK
jgi:hypothetical protein